MGAPATNSGRAVLVIEDDEPTRRSLCALLDETGYAVVGARDGADAIDWLARSRSPSVILLDLTMSGMNGWQFREWQRRTPHANVPVILMSASSRIAEDAHALGVATFVPKPIDFERLLALIERCRQP